LRTLVTNLEATPVEKPAAGSTAKREEKYIRLKRYLLGNFCSTNGYSYI
jgi:hypothetical protein